MVSLTQCWLTSIETPTLSAVTIPTPTPLLVSVPNTCVVMFVRSCTLTFMIDIPVMLLLMSSLLQVTSLVVWVLLTVWWV